MDASEAYKVVLGFLQTFPSLGESLNRSASEVLPVKNLIGIQANRLRRYEIEEAREVLKEWQELFEADPRYEDNQRRAALLNVLNSPEIGLNIAAVIQSKRDKAAKEEQADIARAKTQQEQQAFLEMDGEAAAVVDEMTPLHREYLAGHMTGEQYSEALRKSYTRHGFKEPDKCAYFYE